MGEHEKTLNLRSLHVCDHICLVHLCNVYHRPEMLQENLCKIYTIHLSQMVFNGKITRVTYSFTFYFKYRLTKMVFIVSFRVIGFQSVQHHGFFNSLSIKYKK